MIEEEDTQLSDVIGHIGHVDAGLVIRGYNYKIVVRLRVHVFVSKMMSRLIAKGIMRSYGMRQRRGRPVQQPIGIVSNCDVRDRLVFNAQRYMHMNDAYFAPSKIRFPYEVKKMLYRILHEQQYLHREHQHHFTLDLDQLDRIFEYRFNQSSRCSFPVTNVELKYMFDTLGFLWLHHDIPSYLLYLLEKFVDGLYGERTATLGYIYTVTSSDCTVIARYSSWKHLPNLLMNAMEISKVKTLQCIEMQLL